MVALLLFFVLLFDHTGCVVTTSLSVIGHLSQELQNIPYVVGQIYPDHWAVGMKFSQPPLVECIRKKICTCDKGAGLRWVATTGCFCCYLIIFA